MLCIQNESIKITTFNIFESINIYNGKNVRKNYAVERRLLHNDNKYLIGRDLEDI